MKGLISLIVILFTNLAVFLILDDFNEAFWICYVFAMIAALIATGVEIFYTKKEALIFKYPIMAVTYLYSIVAVVVAVATYKLLQDNLLPLFLINLFVFAFYLTVMLGTSIHNNTIKEQQAVRGRDIIAFKYVLDRMQAVIANVKYEDVNYKKMKHAYDSMASGQVQSNNMARVVENKMLDMINMLDEAVNNKNQEMVADLCHQLELAAEERKRIMNTSNPMW
jgi:hypothetical protein